MKSSLGLNIAKLSSSRFAVQILMFLTAPIITRLFLPEHFGVMQIFDSFLTLTGIVVCLKYELTIPLGKDRQEACASFVLSSFFTTIFATGSLIVVLLYRNTISSLFENPDLAWYLWFFPVFVFVVGLTKALNFWASREGRFGIMALAWFGQLTYDRIFAILFGYMLAGSSIGLLIGRLAGACISLVLLIIPLWKKLLTEIRKAHLTIDILRVVGIRYKKFPLFNAGERLLVSFSLQLLPLIFGIYYSTTIVGYYALANRILMLPVFMLGRTFGQVFFPAAAKEYRETGNLSDIVMNFFTRLVQLSVFPMMVVGLFGTTLFSTVFGHEWGEAGFYAQLMSSWYCLLLLSQPLDIFALLNRQGLALLITLFALLVRTLCLVIGVAFQPPQITIMFFVLFSVFLTLGRMACKFHLCGVSNLWAAGMMLKYIILSCTLLLPIKAMTQFIKNPNFEFVLLGLITLCYGAILMMFDTSIKRFITELLTKLMQRFYKTFGRG